MVLSYSDMAAHHYLPARYYALLGEQLTAKGMDVPALLRDAGIDAAALNAPDAQLSPEQVDTLVSIGADRTHRTDLGFEFGRLIKLSSHDILGYALLSAPTVDYALRLLARYFGLMTPTYRFVYRREERKGEVQLLPQLPLSSRVLAFHQEAIAVAFYYQVTTLLGGTPLPCDIHLSIERPPHAHRYHALTGAVLHFGEERLAGARIVMDAEVLSRPLVMADRNAYAMAESRCAALLAQITREGRLSDWVRMMLDEASDQLPDLEELAQLLHLSSRTLERRLEAEGSRFRDILIAVRHDKACRLLRETELSVTQIALQLGYRDTGNFCRAFARAAGCPPGRYRDSA